MQIRSQAMGKRVLHSERAGLPRRRRGSAVLETVIVLPVLLLVGLGIVSFGLYFANKQQVALGARAGGVAASQVPGLPDTETGDPVPPEIISAIEAQLESSCIELYRVRLEHNLDRGAGGEVVVGPVQVLEYNPNSGTCDCGPADALPGCPILDKYVRLTVCVELNELMPNCLAGFGSDVQVCGQVAQNTVVMRYELD